MSILKPSSVVKNFLHTRDFYNWIKDESGDNSPASYYWFSVNFYHYGGTNSYDGTSALREEFFYSRAQDIADLRYCIQRIKLPAINFTGYTNQGTPNRGRNFRCK